MRDVREPHFLDEVRPEVPALRETVLFTEWDAFLASADPGTALPDVRPDDLVQIQYTSGTTGAPKGAELHHRGLTNNARFFAERIGLAPGEVYVNPMPLFHTAGCGLGVLGEVQSLAVHVPVLAFDPAVVLDLLESERSNLMAGVPTMLLALLEHKTRVKSSRATATRALYLPACSAMRLSSARSFSLPLAR